MANITSTVNLNSTVYRQASSGGNPFFNTNQTYSVPEAPITGNNPMRKPTITSGLPTRPVSPVASNMPVQPTTPASKDPGSAYHFIDSSVQAIAPGDGGVGDATVNQGGNKLKSDLQTIHNAEDKDAAIADVQADPFYKSGSFWDGMLRGALKAYDGGSATEIFDAAQQGTAEGKQREEQNQVKINAQANTEDLLQHYTADSVANYQATGNPQYLRERSLTLEQQQSQKEADENRQDQREEARAERADARQQASFDQQNKLADQRIQAQWDREDRKEGEAKDKAEAKIYSDITKNTISLNKTMRRQESTRLSGFTSAEHTLDAYFKPGASETDKQAALQLAQETAFNAIQGSSTAEKTQHKIQDMLGKPGIVNVVGGKLSWVTGIPRDEQAKYLQTLLKTDSESWKRTYDDDFLSQADANMPEDATEEEKRKVLASVSKGTGRKFTLDQYNKWYDRTYNAESETPSTNGALASGNTSTTPTASAGASKVINKFGL